MEGMDILAVAVETLARDDYNHVAADVLRERLAAIRGTRIETRLMEAADVFIAEVRDNLCGWDPADPEYGPPQSMGGVGMGVIARSLGVSRPRTTEDIEAVRTRAAVRLERRLRRVGKSLRERDARLCREAAALVAALDALLDEREENMEAWAHGDR